MKKLFNENKGQASFAGLITAMAGALGAMIFMYVWLMIWDPITQTLLFPSLEGIEYGAIIQTLFLLIPLLIAIAIVVSCIGYAVGFIRPRGEYGQYPPI